MNALFSAFPLVGHPIAGIPGGWEWLIVLLIILLLFGKKIPTVARSLGQGISNFKKGLNDPVGGDEKERISETAKD